MGAEDSADSSGVLNAYGERVNETPHKTHWIIVPAFLFCSPCPLICRLCLSRQIPLSTN